MPGPMFSWLRRWTLPLLTTLSMMLGGAAWAGADKNPVIVFAAASLKAALDDLGARFEQTTSSQVSLSYGGSSGLARQIQYGAPAQIFLSANTAWMDLLQDENRLIPGSRVDLLSNQLVLIAAPGLDSALTIEPGMELAAALGDGWLAMALVDAVPAGIYGQAALRSLGVWESVQGRIAQTDSVSAALRLVASGEAPLGIVYATDASAEPKVQILGEFPVGSHPPILYPLARLTEADADSAPAQAFYDYLITPEAGALFRKHGFTPLTGDGS